MVERFVIDKRVIGTEKHLAIGDSYSWVDEVPAETWYLNGVLKEDTAWCLDTLLKLGGASIMLDPPKRYHDSMMMLMSGSLAWPPPWKDVMPKAAHRSFVESLVDQVAEELDRLDKTFYRRVWVPGNALFGALQRAAINRDVWLAHLNAAANANNQSTLRTFEPDDAGFAKQARYNRFGSRTGRPSILSGPQILTLKREHRDIIGSRWGNHGRVVMLDFSALEVRVILYEAGQRCDVPDLYQELNDQLFGGKLPRSVVKEAVICDLYGQSRWALGQKLNISKQHVNAFIEKIRLHFKTEQLTKRIKQQFLNDGLITNRYGRRVTIDEPLDHMLVNSYAQSTGADVTTLGFKKLLEQVAHLRVVPVFLLVDAIVLDCHIDDIDSVKSIKDVQIDGYVQRWPLKFEELS